MFIIFGWGRQTIKDHGTVKEYQCRRCNNYKPWNLYTRRTWITLFFIPVFPYAKEHFLICPVCGQGDALDSQEFNELLATIKGIEPAGKTSTVINASNDDAEFAGKTETQINYIKTIREFEAKKKAEESNPS